MADNTTTTVRLGENAQIHIPIQARKTLDIHDQRAYLQLTIRPKNDTNTEATTTVNMHPSGKVRIPEEVREILNVKNESAILELDIEVKRRGENGP